MSAIVDPVRQKFWEDNVGLFHSIKISYRQREIISMRYGLLGKKQHTLGEIGTRWGITTERVRQIIAETERIAARLLEERS